MSIDFRRTLHDRVYVSVLQTLYSWQLPADTTARIALAAKAADAVMEQLPDDFPT